VIALSPAALRHLDELTNHYEERGRPEAIVNLMAAVEAAAKHIEQEPKAGLPAPRPYPFLAGPGRLWLNEMALEIRTGC
jgi:plasmid stabilization system protein ParE